MAHEPVPDDFDWVSAQSKCTSTLMFDRLRTHVRDDVQRRNGVFNRNDGWKFEFREDADDFEAVRLTADVRSSVLALVRFERHGRRIEIRGDEVDTDITAVVTVDATGVCKFVVGEAMYSEWELRKMALEMLFFEEFEEEEDDD